MRNFICYCLAIFLPLSVSAQADLHLKGVFPVEYLRTGNYTFTAAVQNVGTASVSGYKICWQIDNGPVTEESPVSPTFPLGGGMSYPLKITGNFHISFPTEGRYLLKVWTRCVSTNDNNPTNDTLKKLVKVMNNLPDKNVLLEVFKHQACCPCVPAATYCKTIVDTNTRYSYVNIYTGNTDVLYNADGDIVNTVYNLAHPGPFFDRYKFVYATKLERSFYSSGNVTNLTDMGEREKYLEPVSVSYKSFSYDAATGAAKVKLTAKFFDTLSGDYRFNLYLTEDSILAWQGCGIPDPNNYYHMRVLRHMAGGPWGQAGSLPATLYPGDEKDYEFTFTIPSSYKQKHLAFTAMVQQYKQDILDRKILNSAALNFNDAFTLSVAGPAAEGYRINVYPNPASEHVRVTLPGNNRLSTIVLLDIMGKTVLEKPTKEGEILLDLQSLVPGAYLLQVVSEGATYQQKIIKE